jgi:uncharacterized protein (TIGR03437 family)
VLVEQPSIGLWNKGQYTPLRFPIGVGYRPLALSDDAGTLILSTISLNPAAFRSDMGVMDLATGRVKSFFSTVDAKQMATFMAVSNDGRRVLYRVTGPQGPEGPAFVADTATGESTPVSLPGGELVSDGTLNGPGDLAFLVTAQGGIVKVATASGVLEPLIPATPYVRNLGTFAAGSLYALQGVGSGRVLFDGREVPVVYTTAAETAVQVPWELRAGQVPFLLDAPGASPFLQYQNVFVEPIGPRFWPAEAGASSLFGIKIVKGDWSGYVTSMPGPGDIFTIYMTGLGPVAGAVETGVPASATSLNPIQGTLACQFGGNIADTVFAGLAPGMIGIYQATFRIPAGGAAPQFNSLVCVLSNTAGSSLFTLSSVTVPIP